MRDWGTGFVAQGKGYGGGMEATSSFKKSPHSCHGLWSRFPSPRIRRPGTARLCHAVEPVTATSSPTTTQP